MIRAYLAGPDVFLPDAAAHAKRKVAICRGHGIEGIAPVDGGQTGWREIFEANVATMERCEIVVANLTPFRGASADAGTLVELGWFLGRRRRAFGYSNVGSDLGERSRALVGLAGDPIDGLAVEDFGLADNLMVLGALARSGATMVLPQPGETVAFDGLAVFERCIRAIVAAP